MFEKIEMLRMARAMGQHTQARHIEVARNIANADTPGFRAHDLQPFAETYRQAEDGGTLRVSNARHLDAPLIRDAVKQLAPNKKGILFIENIGNLVCPAEFVIGEHMKLLVSTVTEGSDKPYKYPLAFEKADGLILNKSDLMPYIDFDMDFFTKGFRALNPQAPLFKVSARTGDGFAQVAQWLEEKALALHEAKD